MTFNCPYPISSSPHTWAIRSWQTVDDRHGGTTWDQLMEISGGIGPLDLSEGSAKTFVFPAFRGAERVLLTPHPFMWKTHVPLRRFCSFFFPEDVHKIMSPQYLSPPAKGVKFESFLLFLLCQGFSTYIYIYIYFRGELKYTHTPHRHAPCQKLGARHLYFPILDDFEVKYCALAVQFLNYGVTNVSSCNPFVF